MNLEEYGQMYQVESSHWYFVGKRAIIKRLLESVVVPGRQYKLLDIGCGTGNILTLLQDFGDAVGVDSSSLALEFCKQRGLHNLHLVEPDVPLPFSDNSFDIICAFDILEHVEDDCGLLLEMKRICKEGGMILMIVPAYPFLWSDHDEALHHKRRYSKTEFQSLISRAQLRCLRLTYFNSFLFPLALTYRIFRRLLPRKRELKHSEFFVKVPRPFNEALLSIFLLEGGLLARMNFPAGLSLFSVCEKVK